ncbi:uncharacterized protein LOC134337692 [Mobula hypostoma]|uniref:uncharacterized protein LOC134337692 n=1 Tax=Mobula hypostoma TaxID=723540 RepID=UPI002FC3B7A9
MGLLFDTDPQSVCLQSPEIPGFQIQASLLGRAFGVPNNGQLWNPEGGSHSRKKPQSALAGRGNRERRQLLSGGTDGLRFPPLTRWPRPSREASGHVRTARARAGAGGAAVSATALRSSDERLLRCFSESLKKMAKVFLAFLTVIIHCITSAVLSTPDTSKICKTEWFNIDDPSGEGDYEVFNHLYIQFPNRICLYPITCEVETTSGVPASQTGENIEPCNVARGFFCKNDDQSDQMCQDYRIRFTCPQSHCPTPATTTGARSTTAPSTASTTTPGASSTATPSPTPTTTTGASSTTAPSTASTTTPGEYILPILKAYCFYYNSRYCFYYNSRCWFYCNS